MKSLSWQGAASVKLASSCGASCGAQFTARSCEEPVVACRENAHQLKPVHVNRTTRRYNSANVRFRLLRTRFAIGGWHERQRVGVAADAGPARLAVGARRAAAVLEREDGRAAAEGRALEGAAAAVVRPETNVAEVVAARRAAAARHDVVARVPPVMDDVGAAARALLALPQQRLRRRPRLEAERKEAARRRRLAPLLLVARAPWMPRRIAREAHRPFAVAAANGLAAQRAVRRVEDERHGAHWARDERADGRCRWKRVKASYSALSAPSTARATLGETIERQPSTWNAHFTGKFGVARLLGEVALHARLHSPSRAQPSRTSTRASSAHSAHVPCRAQRNGVTPHAVGRRAVACEPVEAQRRGAQLGWRR